jgi:hypothetical protein
MLNAMFIADGEFLVEECGPAVCAVADIFLSYFKEIPGKLCAWELGEEDYCRDRGNP